MARPRQPGGFTWDPGIARYRGPNGKIVGQDKVRLALDTAIRNAEREAVSLGARMAEGSITGQAFYRDMRQLVKNVHLFSAAAAKGGWAQMTQADFGRVGAQLRSEYAYLDGFAGEIDAGIQPLNGNIGRRAGDYIHAGRGTYDRTQIAAMREAGMTEEKNVLHPAEHCEGPNSCIEQRDRGWVPLGELVPIGDRRCRRRCKCTKRFR